MSRFLDEALDDDDDRRYDALRDDGWSNADILHRRYLSQGRYVGPKDDQQDPGE